MDDTKTFAEMFEESYATPKRFSVGEKAEAMIVKISPEWIFIDLGAKSEGYIDKKELLEIKLDITHFPVVPESKTKFVVFGKISDYRPDLCGIPVLVKIAEIITGEVVLNIIDKSFDSYPKTLVEVFLQDPKFLNLDWFDAL